MIITTSVVSHLQERATEAFLLSFDEVPTVYQELFEMKDADSAFEGRSYGAMGSVVGEGEPTEIEEGQDHNFFGHQKGWVAYWKMRIFQRGFQITNQDLKNLRSIPNLRNYVEEQSRKLGMGMKRGRDRRCMNIFNYGSLTAGNQNLFDGSYPNGQDDPYPKFIYDGKPFFATDHPLKNSSGTTYSNLDTTLGFSYENLEAALIAHQVTNAKGEKDEEIENPVDTILIPWNMKFDVERVLKSVLRPGTNNNDKNVVMDEGLSVVTSRRLTDTDAWFLGQRKKGLCMITRGEPKLVVDMEKLKGTGVLKMSFVDEYGLVVTQWRNWSAYKKSTSAIT